MQKLDNRDLRLFFVSGLADIPDRRWVPVQLRTAWKRTEAAASVTARVNLEPVTAPVAAGLSRLLLLLRPASVAVSFPPKSPSVDPWPWWWRWPLPLAPAGGKV